MSQGTDGSFVCDKCGVDVGNGELKNAAAVGRLDLTTSRVLNFNFCEDREEDGKKVKGCANKVLSATNLKHYNETKESQNDNAQATPSEAEADNPAE